MRACLPAGVAVPGGLVACPQQLSPDELSGEVFRWLHDEEVVDAPYLQVPHLYCMCMQAASVSATRPSLVACPGPA